MGWIKQVKPKHDCRPPTVGLARSSDFGTGSEWQCDDCSDIWRLWVGPGRWAGRWERIEKRTPPAGPGSSMSGFWLYRNGEKYQWFERKSDAENIFFMRNLNSHLAGTDDEWEVKPGEQL